MQVAPGWMAEAGVHRLPRERLSGKAQEPPGAETRLVALATAGAPLRRAIAAIAGRLVAIRGWERLGFARLRDYSLERVGVSPRQVQELAYVDAALRERGLTGTEAAFVAGRLTWTKLRLLCRVATAADEGRWLALAEQISARALAREVRAVDARALDARGAETETDEEGAEESPRETVFLRCAPAVRSKWHRARFLASRQAGQSIPAWAVAEAVAAEVVSALPLDAAASRSLEVAAQGASEGSPRTHALPGRVGHFGGSETANGCAAHGSSTGVTGGAAARGEHRADFLRSLIDRLEEADAFELDARLRRAISFDQRLNAEIGPLLLAVARERLYRAYGCPSLGAFAREWLGMSPRKAEALLRLERACVVCPSLREAYRSGRLSWAKAQILVPIAVLDHSEPWRSEWVRRAESVTVRRLDDDVERALATGLLDPDAAEGPDPGLEPDPQTSAPPRGVAETERFFFNAPRDVARLFRAVLATTQRRLERLHARVATESEALDAMLEHAFEAWGLWNTRVRREHRVFDRDGWRCSVPGCSSSRNLQDHHIEFRSAGGSDELANRTTLCAWHHLRGVHAGTVRVAGTAPERLRFELGVRRGRSPLVTFVSGDRLASGCRP
jgi:hypothetical protein